MEDNKPAGPPPIPVNRTPPPVPQAKARTSIPSRRKDQRLKRPPAGVDFSLYTDGFEGEFHEGNYITSSIWLTASTLAGFGISYAISGGFFSWIFAAAGLFGVYRGLRQAIGELRIRYRKGRIQVRSGLLGLGQSVDHDIPIDEIRTIRLTRKESGVQASGKFSSEAIVISTNNKSYRFGGDLPKKERDYLYEALVFFLDKEMNRVKPNGESIPANTHLTK